VTNDSENARIGIELQTEYPTTGKKGTELATMTQWSTSSAVLLEVNWRDRMLVCGVLGRVHQLAVWY